MNGLNISTGSPPPQGFSIQEGAPAGPTTPPPPATNLGPPDSTSTSEELPPPAVNYQASSGVPSLPPPSREPNPVTLVPSGVTSTGEGGDSENAGAQLVASQTIESAGSETLTVSLEIPRRNQEQDGDGSSGGGQGQQDGDGSSGGGQEQQGGGALRREFGDGSIGEGRGQQGGGALRREFDDSSISGGTGQITPPPPPTAETGPIVLTPDVDLDPGQVFTGPTIIQTGLGTTITGANEIDGTGYVDNPSDFNGVLGNLFTQAQETIDSILDKLNQMPDTPEKLKMVDFLKAVSQAIIDLQEMLQIMQGFDAEKEKTLTKAQLDTSLAKIQTQLDAITKESENIKDQQKKEKALSKIGLSTQALNLIIMVVMVIIALPAIIAAGPIGGTIIAAFIVVIMTDMIMKMAGDEKGVFTRMMDDIGKGVANMMIAFGETNQDVIDAVSLAFKVVITAAIIAVLVVASPACALLVCSSGISSMISACKIGSEIARLAGADEKTQMWVEFGVSCAAMAVMIIGSLGTKGLQVASDAIQTTHRLVLGMLKLADVMGKRGAQTAFQVCTALSEVALQAGNSAVNLQLKTLQSALVMLQASAEGDTEIKDALIKIIKDIIKKLQEALSGMNDFLGSLNTMQTNMYRDLSANLPM